MNNTDIPQLAKQLNFQDIHELYLEKYKNEIEHHIRTKRTYQLSHKDIVDNVLEPLRRDIAMRVCEEMAEIYRGQAI